VRVLGLLPYPTRRVPGQRYRIEQWAPLLEREGVALTFSPFLSERGMDVLYRPGNAWTKARETARGYFRRIGEVLRPGSFDVVYVFREAALLGPAWLEQMVARRLPVVFDFDDAIYLPATSPANAWASILKPAGKADAICRLARHVTVGNEFLAAYASRHCKAVTVVPTTIDTDLYRPAARPANARPIVGWSGSSTTAAYLQTRAAALGRLRQRLDFELHVIGGTVSVPGVETRLLPWRAETEVEDLRPFDVGLMPLSDDEWARGKCGLKALQYMALGIPPVVSPVGVNASIVEDGVNGFHARDDGEWVDRIANLLGDPDLRARLGAAARRTVEQRYSAAVQAPRMARVFRETAGH
jgi:glycosyltransferase involved in cell wall biosynthesis